VFRIEDQEVRYSSTLDEDVVGFLLLVTVLAKAERFSGVPSVLESLTMLLLAFVVKHRTAI
jgi:hypothetical protein